MHAPNTLPETMRAVVVQEPGTWSIETVDVPDPDPVDSVVCRVDAASICGTDPKIVDGRIEGWPPSFPFIPGHEWAGTVVATHGDVDRVEPGDRVFTETHSGCGHCENCRRGAYNLCLHYGDHDAGHRQIGHTAQGAFAEYIAVPADVLHPLPAGIGMREATLLDVNAIALSLAERGRIRPGDTVAVIGTGTVGLLAVQHARVMGASDVIGVGSPAKNAVAERLGADHTIPYDSDDVVADVLDRTDGVGVDVTLEAAGAPVGFAQAVEITRKGGTVSLDGIPDENRQSIPIADLVTNQIEFRGCRAHANRSMASARLVNAGQVDVGALITHEFTFDEFEDAWRTATRSGGDAIKVSLRY